MPAANSQPIKTPLARLSHPHLFKKYGRDGQKAKYQATLIFASGTDLSALRDRVIEVAKAQWGEKAVKMLQEGIIKNPFLDGNGKQGRDAEGELKPGMGPGVVFIRCSSESVKPKVVDQKRAPVEDEDAVYPGMYVYAMVHAYAWEHPSNGKGISFGLDAVQLVRDGERLGGGGNVNVNTAFDEIPDEGSAPAATQTQGASALFG
jgi:hypothetical protein